MFVPFPCPWLMVMLVVLITKTVIFCTITWDSIIQSLQNLVVISPNHVSHTIKFWSNSVEHIFCTVMFVNFKMLTNWRQWHIYALVNWAIWLKLCLVAFPASSHYVNSQNQLLIYINRNLRNKVRRNSNQNTKILIEENAFQNVIRKISIILFWPHCINNGQS